MFLGHQCDTSDASARDTCRANDLRTTGDEYGRFLTEVGKTLPSSVQVRAPTAGVRFASGPSPCCPSGSEHCSPRGCRWANLSWEKKRSVVKQCRRQTSSLVTFSSLVTSICMHTRLGTLTVIDHVGVRKVIYLWRPPSVFRVLGVVEAIVGHKSVETPDHFCRGTRYSHGGVADGNVVFLLWVRVRHTG